MAADVELPEIARHDLRRGGGVAKTVAAATGDKFQIRVRAAGEMCRRFGVLDGVQNGTVRGCHTAPYYFFGKDPTFAMDCAIPFGINARQMTAWMYDGNGMKLLRSSTAASTSSTFRWAIPARRWAGFTARRSSRSRT